ncbi:TPA: hypothetical protein DCW38_08090 [candidate division WOR-3 bacterium]|jgi:hypothetical protein|uniref:Response regulatory domain-containing protein n=1 Tax=candidate division WOR-3 bacterium TaxID=2052148 RepID=A0A350HC56_UNCW3|nr:hypothetical protein [candidate division WOR-3 bacterium]
MNKKISILSNDNEIKEKLKEKFANVEYFDNYISLITSSMINKFPMIIIDSKELPIFNEQKIINSINQFSPKSKIIYISRIDDIEYQKIVRNNNQITYYANYPVDMFSIEKIINTIFENFDKVEYSYE